MLRRRLELPFKFLTVKDQIQIVFINSHFISPLQFFFILIQFLKITDHIDICKVLMPVNYK